MHALQVSRPTPRGEVEGSGKGGGVVSRPTPRGEVEGSGKGGWSPGPHPGVGGVEGSGLGGLQPHTRGVSRPTIAGGQHTSYWNALLLNIVIPMINKQ